MQLYAETTTRRYRQVAGDLAVLVWAVIWIRVGIFIKHLVEKLAQPGRSIEDASRGFAQTLEGVGEDVSSIPGIGGSLRSPFDSAAEAGRALEGAGAAQQDVVFTLAAWLGVLLALIPIVVLLIRYLPGRLAWIREATVAGRLRAAGGSDALFAHRAVANRSLSELYRVTRDPGAALVRGEYAALAGLELESLGLDRKNPEPSVVVPDTATVR